MGKIKVLVISSCSGEKKFSIDNPAIARDLDNFELRMKKEEELQHLRIKAKEMFISSQNKYIEEGIKTLKENGVSIDYSFISSGYGYLNSEDYVIPYDVNFSAMSAYDIEKRGDFLRLNQETAFSAKNYDLVFFLLGHEYLRALNLPFRDIKKETKQIFFVTKSDEKVIHDVSGILRMEIGNDEVKTLNIKSSDLKGYIFKLIANESSNIDVMSKIYNQPSYIDEIVNKNKDLRVNSKTQLSLFDLS